MSTCTKPPVYRIYLLTVWQTQGQAEAAEAGWRFHLTNPHTGERYGFTNAEALIVRLQQLANEHRPTDEA
jgi:hypothetical protein